MIDKPPKHSKGTPPRPKLYWDPRGDQPLEIVQYFHCGDCLTEFLEGTPLLEDHSIADTPKEYARTQAGLTDTGAVQVWCNRHEKNVIILSAVPREGLVYR